MTRTKRFYNRVRAHMHRWGSHALYHPWRQDLVLTSMIPSQWRRQERRKRRRYEAAELRAMLRREATGTEFYTYRGWNVYDAEWYI